MVTCMRSIHFRLIFHFYSMLVQLILLSLYFTYILVKERDKQNSLILLCILENAFTML